MSRAAFAWLGGAALALAAIIAAEFSAGTAPPPVAGAAVVMAARNVAAGAPVAGSERRWTAAILERPLFNPARRPPGEPSEAGSFRLSGTIVGPDGRRAIFEPAGTGRPVIVREGERMEGAVVRAIAPGLVLVVGADGPRLLAPSYTTPSGAVAAGTPPLARHLATPAAPVREAK
jgi:hypothetical protein